ncbi:hypothetical protein Sango_0655600 [Sesamum angolense]|uniref:CCHC-type domain-containing protein n=1 Tax=Sesamum angolense TaxID=2727404 RepID=A0AAE2C2C7_9LAMI|nr:hypothetical protein Sango_0655600 [Sesamum angolense]
MSFLDPRTNDSELEVQRIILLQNVANRLPDAFIDTKKVTKSHIPAENIPARLEVPEATLTQSKASESQIRRKRGRPLGSKDANPRKRKEHIVSINHDANVTTSNVSEDKIPEVILSEDPKRNEQDLEDSYEMSINYAHNSLGWYRKEIEMNDIFAYSVVVEIMHEDDNDPQTMEECQRAKGKKARRWERKKGKAKAKTVVVEKDAMSAPVALMGMGKGKKRMGTQQQSRANDICTYCREKGHWKKDCPNLSSDQGMFVIEVNMVTNLLHGYWIPVVVPTYAMICKCYKEELSKDEVVLRVGDGKAVAAVAVGIINLVARGGFSYFITFIDNHSRYSYVYLMRYKSEAFVRFKEFRSEVENQTGRKIKTLRSNRCGEI